MVSKKKIGSRDAVWGLCGICRRNRAKTRCEVCHQFVCYECEQTHHDRNSFAPDPDDTEDTTMMPEDEG